MSLEFKSIPLEVKDVDTQHRTAIIAHATYDNIDRGKDILRKGAFAKSWKEHKDDVAFYLNHNDEMAPGKVVELFEDDNHAYTKAWMGTHTLGDDTLKMMDEGVIKKASFGFLPVKANKIEVKGVKVREIKELYHGETSVLTKLQMNPGSGVISVTKSFGDVPKLINEFKTLTSDEQNFLTNVIMNGNASLMAAITLANGLDPDSDLYTYINYFISQMASQMGDLKSQLKWGRKDFSDAKAHLETMEKFVRNTTASDDCIKLISKEAEEIKAFLSIDTADTRVINEPAASNDDAIRARAILFNMLKKVS
jgi:HK97 family phage prohead protease